MLANSPLWVARVLWLVVGALGALAIDAATDQRSSVAGTIAAIAWWLPWGLVLVALLVPSPLGLTATRLLAPTLVVGAGAAAAFGDSVGILAAGAAAVFAVVSFGAPVGQASVQGSAYGDEQRFLLRIPAPFIAPAVLMTTLWIGAAVGSVLAAAASAWLIAVPAAVVAGGSGWVLFKRLHRLSRRWLVVVPAGLVIHDHVVLAETLMVPRGTLVGVHLAEAGTDAADLTGPAGGYALEVRVNEAVTALLIGTRQKPQGTALHVTGCLVAPSRPGQTLAAIAQRSMPVG